jgi:dihydroorotate dehydrogenase
MDKYDLVFSSPILNAAGVLGFSPDQNKFADVRRLGAFITNPISFIQRTPAAGTRFLPFQGGFLLHSGYPNLGFRRVVRRYSRAWAESPVPVIVHLLAENRRDLSVMVQKLEGMEGVMGIELGLPPDIDGESAAALVASAVGELPIIVKLPLDRAREIVPYLSFEASLIISLGPPRGELPNHQGKLVQGRLYGPSLLPQSLALVKKLSAQGCRVIGAGGVYSSEDIRAMLSAGALAVMLDAVLWRDGVLPDWEG